MQDISAIKYSLAEVKTRRKRIRNLLLQRSENINSPDIGRISSSDLELMYRLYDQAFFQDWIKANYEGRLQFSISQQMTKSAGKTICAQSDPAGSKLIEVRISLPIISNYGTVPGHDRVGGVKSGSRLEALQLIFEHELIHVLEFICFGKSSCRQNRFKQMAHNLFGHQESYHQLPTNNDIAQQRLGLFPGGGVEFQFQGATVEGILYKIRKRAVVLVADPDGPYQDPQGNRYCRYLVPLTLLRPR